jgi:hypothetical protein
MPTTAPRKGRPRGFASWNPQPATLAVLGDIQSVLDEYRSHLPLTARQIFYRLVGQYGYEKTERAYARLCEYLVRARRAQLIDFSAIRDDGTTHNEYLRYNSPADFWRQVEENAAHYSRDKLDGQPVYVELWCEAAGMVPQLERVANAYSVPVYSTGGFSSVTVTYEIADRALARDKPTVFLHVGDFDPSGESIFDAMTRDAQAFLLSRLYWDLYEADRRSVFPDGTLSYGQALPAGYPNLLARRVALTGEQVDEYGLPTAPPKASDSRSVSWYGDTCQLEAMPPDTLAEVVREAITDELDADALDAVRDAENEERQTITSAVARFLQ